MPILGQALSNIFRKKKKPQYPSAQGTNMSITPQSSPYDLNAPKQAASSGTVNQSSFRTGGGSASGTAGASGSWGQPKPQGGQQYASPIGPQPAPAPKPAPPSFDSSGMYSGQAQRARDLTADRRTQGEALANKQFALNRSALEGQGARLGTQMTDFMNATNEETEALRAKTDRSRGQVSDDFGESQRQAMRTRRETLGETEGRFANLNTVGGTGYGSQQRANENIESEFNRYTQQNLKDKTGRLADLEEGYATAERQASAAIRQKQFEIDSIKSQIQTALAQNDISKASALNDIYQQAQQEVFGIETAMNELRTSFEQEAQSQQGMMDQLGGLSEEFRATGVPTTQHDLMFSMQNPEMSKNYADILGKQGEGNKPKSASQLQVEGKAAAGIRALDTMGSEIANNSNIMAQAMIPGSPGARQYKAAISSITDAIGGLRTGASVSPEQQKFYEYMLPKYGDSDETIKNKLNELRTERSGSQQGASPVSTPQQTQQAPQQSMEQLIAMAGG